MLVQVQPQRPEQQEQQDQEQQQEQHHVQQEQQQEQRKRRMKIILVWVVVLLLVVLGGFGLIFLLGGRGPSGFSAMPGPPPDTGGPRYRREHLEHAVFMGPNYGAFAGSFGLDANYVSRDNDGREVFSHHSALVTELPMSLLSSIVAHNEDPQQREQELELCFTNNLYMWEQWQQHEHGLEQHYSDNHTVSSNIAENNTFHLELVHRSNDFRLETFCVSLELQPDQSRRLPNAFQPRRYGAALLVANSNRKAGGSSTSPSASLLAVCIYNAQHQESHHLSYRSVWQSTTDQYNITGTVTVEGVVSLSSTNNYALVAQDEQVLFFSNVQITPMVGPLVLYLANRTTTTTNNNNSEWPQVNASQDLFVHGGGRYGSFSQRGTFQLRWPHPTVNIADYAGKGGGYWLLRCGDCDLTIAIAPLLPVA